jgi:hypothetical protein
VPRRLEPGHDKRRSPVRTTPAASPRQPARRRTASCDLYGCTQNVRYDKTILIGNGHTPARAAAGMGLRTRRAIHALNIGGHDR